MPDASVHLRAPFSKREMAIASRGSELQASSHPDDHPRATIRLIDALINPVEARFGDDDLKSIVERVRRADPQIATMATFRTWSDRVRTQQR